MVQATLLGYPRLGLRRELKFAVESYWEGRSSLAAMKSAGADLRKQQWLLQKRIGMDSIPSNDFSFYDHMLDMSALFGVVPGRYGWGGGKVDLDTYFAMARGVQKSGMDVPACEMTKWFDTNYHYIVPEFEENQIFRVSTTKAVDAYLESKEVGIETRPVLVGPVTYLLLGKNVKGGSPLCHLDKLVEAYIDVLGRLADAGASWVQFDEPCLVTDLDEATRQAYTTAYKKIREGVPTLKLFVATPYGALDDNLALAASLPIDALHVDLVRGGTGQVEAVLAALPSNMILAAGIVDGRNIWINDLKASLDVLEHIASVIGLERLWVCSSCSLLHVPYDLDLETKMESSVRAQISFAKKKLDEIAILALGVAQGRMAIAAELSICDHAFSIRESSPYVNNRAVAERLSEQPLSSAGRAMPYAERSKVQHAKLGLPLFPTTTIGSFPQTQAVRKMRADWRGGLISKEMYEDFVKQRVKECIAFQEEVGLDVLVHGEFERNDMVEFFGEKLKGFLFTEHGWVQSYGTRAVKPPIILGDVYRPEPMTIALSTYAQGVTSRPVKGMLTGPVTILQWSFVREDQQRSVTAHQIALALQDEVLGLEAAGMKVIQIDEPAFREGLPLRKKDQPDYFKWAVQAFRMVSTGVKNETQIHSHMCYSEFNDIIASIKALDADVLSIETSRSQMELLRAFVDFIYPNEIGPGVYDIHSPRVPSEDEIVRLLVKACEHLKPEQIWVNPDCGLKTRDWPETKLSLARMVMAAKTMRARYQA
ncbi:MAG: 5-methyltetrahydropteroyltriglutamate--homocysteine S-methyltransferase [Bdellovibrionales bacterium]